VGAHHDQVAREGAGLLHDGRRWVAFLEHVRKLDRRIRRLKAVQLLAQLLGHSGGIGREHQPVVVEHIRRLDIEDDQAGAIVSSERTGYRECGGGGR
jgi:hypothetical protein